MKKTFIKTFSLALAISVLSLIGFNSAFGYGGGGGGGGYASSCSSVTYGEWGTCINDMQYRDVISQTPKYCKLSTSQQLARSKKCSEVVPATTTPEEVVEPAEEPEQEVLGERKYTDGTLLRGSDMKIYVVVGGTLKHILSLEELMKYAGKEILNVEDSEIDSFGKGEVLGDKKYADGTLLRGSDMKIYIIVGGKKKHILNLEELIKYAGLEILNVEDGVVNGIENS